MMANLHTIPLARAVQYARMLHNESPSRISYPAACTKAANEFGVDCCDVSAELGRIGGKIGAEIRKANRARKDRAHKAAREAWWNND